MSIKKYTNGSWTPASYRKYGTETDSITTLPATIIGDGTPITSYTVKGNMEQSGTPTPSSPIYPSECGERTENVMPSAPAETKTSNGITITCDGNGVYTLSGTALSSVYIPFRFKDFTIPISVGQGGQGTMSLFNTAPSGQLGMAFLNGDTSIDAWWINSENRKSNTYSAMSGAVCNAIQFYVPSENNCDCVIKPCFTNDSIYPATYIPYGYKLPLTLGSTTTDIYLGEVQSTRKIKKLVLTGEEGWRRTSNKKYYIDLENGCPNDYLKQLTITSICSHYQSQNNTSSGSNEVDAGHFCFYTGRGFELYIGETTIPSATDFKTYLQQQYAAGTPVTIWYVLANPTTGIVNEPIRKIGDYVDSVSGTNLATSGAVQEFNINTTLKPSEADLTYHGWHEHEDTKFTT